MLHLEAHDQTSSMAGLAEDGFLVQSPEMAQTQEKQQGMAQGFFPKGLVLVTFLLAVTKLFRKEGFFLAHS